MDQEDENKIADELRRQGLVAEPGLALKKVVAWSGPLRVVRQNELTGATDRGQWTVLATYEADVPSWDYEMTSHTYGQTVVGAPKRILEADRDYCGSQRDKVKDDETPHFVLRQRFFVLGQTRDQLLEEYRMDRESAQTASRKARVELQSLREQERKRIEAEDKVEDDLQEQRESLKTRLQAVRDREQAYKLVNKKMEHDLGRLRKALGERVWGEILPADRHEDEGVAGEDTEDESC